MSLHRPPGIAVPQGRRPAASDLIPVAFGPKQPGNEWFLSRAILELSDENRAMRREIELLTQRLDALEKAGAR